MSEHGENGGSFISGLLQKLAVTKQIAEVTGRSTKAAEREVERQIRQASKGGDPVKGKGVTKSGGDD
jgi:hypothetical protein